MSSLAGALDETKPYVVPKHEDDTPSVDAGDDIEMADAEDQPDEKQEDEEMDDLFGQDEVDDVKPKEPSSPTSEAADRLPSPERERRHALEYEEEEAPQEIAVEVKEAEVSFPNIPVPKSSDGDNWVIRMPNYVRMDSKPFHPDTYIGPEHEDEDFSQTENVRQKSMTIKLKVENTVRWRWTKDEFGQDQRQSNSRIIRWSDGTLSLRLGKELFDITQSVDTSAGVPRQLGSQQPPQSQSQSQPPASQADGANKSQGLTYLVAQHKRSQVLQAEAVVTGYMSLRPTGMQSETHRMLVRAVGQKHNKVARLRMAPEPTMDPEREKLELMKQSAKKTKKKATTTEYDDELGAGRRRRGWRKSDARDVWSDDDDDEIAAGGAFEGSDEEEDGGRRSGGKAKKASDKKGMEDYQEDDFVVADSSDEDGVRGGRAKRKNRDRDDDDDPLDKLDAKIERQARAESSGGGEMDVESEEEEEEEFKVRRLGGSGSRKRAAAFDDDDDEE